MAPNDLNNLSSIVNNTSSTELGNRQILFQSDYQDAVQEDDKIILSTKLFNKTEIECAFFNVKFEAIIVFIYYNRIYRYTFPLLPRSSCFKTYNICNFFIINTE